MSQVIEGRKNFFDYASEVNPVSIPSSDQKITEGLFVLKELKIYAEVDVNSHFKNVVEVTILLEGQKLTGRSQGGDDTPGAIFSAIGNVVDSCRLFSRRLELKDVNCAFFPTIHGFHVTALVSSQNYDASGNGTHRIFEWALAIAMIEAINQLGDGDKKAPLIGSQNAHL